MRPEAVSKDPPAACEQVSAGGRSAFYAPSAVKSPTRTQPSGSSCGRGLRRLRRARGVDADPCLAGPHDRLGARGRADLPEDVRDVIAHRLLADTQPLGDVTVAEPA